MKYTALALIKRFHILFYIKHSHIDDKIYRKITKYEIGLTIIELLITLAIIGIISTIAINETNKYIQKNQVTSAIQEIKNIEKEIYFYKNEHNEWPDSLNEIYGNGAPEDPWHRTYKYYPINSVSTGKLRKDRSLVPINTDFDLYSIGADGKSKKTFRAPMSQDDIVRANNGDFVGLVKNY